MVLLVAGSSVVEIVGVVGVGEGRLERDFGSIFASATDIGARVERGDRGAATLDLERRRSSARVITMWGAMSRDALTA